MSTEPISFALEGMIEAVRNTVWPDFTMPMFPEGFGQWLKVEGERPDVDGPACNVCNAENADWYDCLHCDRSFVNKWQIQAHALTFGAKGGFCPPRRYPWTGGR